MSVRFAGRYFAFGVVMAFVALTGSSTAGVSAQSTPSVVISEVHPSGSGNGTYGADWFEVTNTSGMPDPRSPIPD